MQSTSSYDIIVVGLGPVGLLACNILGMRGYRVLGIDKITSAYSFPRAIHMDDEIVRIIQSVGLRDELFERIKPMNGLELLDHNHKLLFRGANKFPSGYPSNHFLFFQPELERVLRMGCGSYPNVTLQYGTEITVLTQTANKVSIESNGEKLAEAHYLIGCDGARSFIRTSLGIGLNDLGFKKSALKIDAYDLSHESPALDTVQKICSHTKPWVHMKGVGNHLRWELNYTDGLSKEEIEKPGTASRMLKEIGVDTTQLEIVHAVVYYFKSVLAKEWQRGNIFLAGDAAHTTPPYVGQGMCAGFRDIMNLSWKLDAVIKGELPSDSLSTYQTERYAHARELILLADLVGWIFTTRLWYVLKIASKIPVLNNWLVNFKIPKTKDGKGHWGSGKAKRSLFPQIKTDDGTYTDMLFSNEWALVSIGKKIDNKVTYVCEKASLKYVELSSNDSSVAQMTEWAKRYNAGYFIIRPDLYVFSSGNNAVELCDEFITKNKIQWKS